MHRITLAAVITAALTTACGDTDAPAIDDPNTVTLSGTLTAAVFNTPIADASVCAVAPNLGCVTTDLDGAFAISGLPKHTDVTFEVKADGFVSALAVFHTGDTDHDDAGGALFDRSLVESVYADAGIDYQPMLGAIVVYARQLDSDDGAQGYTLGALPQTGDGPFFTAGTGVDAAMTETGDNGTAALINLPAGSYEVSLNGPGNCQPDLSAQGDDGSFIAPVKLGFTTYVRARCSE